VHKTPVTMWHLDIHIGWVVVYHNKLDPHMTEIDIDIPVDNENLKNRIGIWEDGIQYYKKLWLKKIQA
jgi:hypothetical protein